MADTMRTRSLPPATPNSTQAESQSNFDPHGNPSLGTPTTCLCNCQNPLKSTTFKRRYSKFLYFWFPLLVSIVAAVFTIFSLFASWKSLEAANRANKWAYYGYEAALVQIRVALMEFCKDPLVPPVYNATCDRVREWEYLQSVYDTYHPDGMQQAPVVPIPVQRKVSDTTVVVACFGGVIAVVPLVAVAVLAGGWKRRMGVGTREMI